MFKEFTNDVVILAKPDGSRIEKIEAHVQSDSILVPDASLPIEEGDVVERERPGGIVERYLVLDAGYFPTMHGVPAHFQLKVRKETVIPRTAPGSSNTYYLSGSNSRVNTNSIDASTNISTSRVTQVFEDLRAALVQVENEQERAQIREHVDEMESTQGTPGFMARYQAFVEAAANHITVVAPFLSDLTKMLS